MTRKTHRRKTHRSKSSKRRHSRKQTRKSYGGACPCSGAMRPQFGGRGGMGGAELGHAYQSPAAYTTGATQELNQMLPASYQSVGGGQTEEKRLARERAEEMKRKYQAMTNNDFEANLEAFAREHANKIHAERVAKMLPPKKGGAKGSTARARARAAHLAERAAERAALNAEREREQRAILSTISRAAANEGARRTRRRMITNRRNKFGKAFVVGMPLAGYEGNKYKHLNRNEMKNKIREEALSEYVNIFGNNNGFKEIDLELNNNNNMGNVIIPASHNYRPSGLF